MQDPGSPPNDLVNGPVHGLANFLFNVDLTDLILNTLPDVRSLQSFVLCSKSVYNVFDTHRASVLRAVVSNHLGPATRPAIRLLKVMLDVDSYHIGLLPLPVADLPREEDFQLADARNEVIVTMREAHLLAANHDVVRELEGLYSWRNKDPRCTSSQLMPRESMRFQEALYRFWFICTLYGRPARANRLGRHTPKRLRKEIMKCLGKAQMGFIPSFKSYGQVSRVLDVWKFVTELARWSVRAEFLPHEKMKEYVYLEEYLVWSGPTVILQAFQGRLESVIDQEVVPIMAGSYKHFCDAMNAVRLAKRPRSGKGILGSPFFSFLSLVSCKRCGHPYLDDMPLWNESNWYFLRGVVPPSTFFEFLGIDWWNSCIDPLILEEICRKTPYSELVGEVFDLRMATYRSWNHEDWLCMGCLRGFLHDNMEELFRQRQYPQSSFFAWLP